LDEAIRRHLQKALQITNGRIFGKNGAAELLGVKPTTLQSKLHKFGIRREDFLN